MELIFSYPYPIPFSPNIKHTKRTMAKGQWAITNLYPWFRKGRPNPWDFLWIVASVLFMNALDRT